MSGEGDSRADTLDTAGGDDKKDKMRRFTTHAFRKTPTGGHGHVLAWGWMYKQGQGGLLHRKNWKRRFFVLYTVPQGNVLVYYDKQSVNGDDIRGFIDLRKVTTVRDAGTKSINRKDMSVIEIVTGPRTFVVAPDSINKTLSTPVVPRLQFILGWPVPEPEFSVDEITSELPDDQAQVFGTWLDVISVQVKLEQETRSFDVVTVADSTEALPEKLTLRATPTDLALLDAADPDQAHTCWSYRDLVSWSCPIPTELHISVRIPSAPVRCVFRADNATEIKALIESHVNSILKNEGK